MNGFYLKLECSGESNSCLNDHKPDYSPEYDNINTLLSDLCDVLGDHSGLKFSVSGFGGNAWPVDVRTDLLTVVEVLNEIINRISCGAYNFDLDLYEQGMERKLFFQEVNDMIVVTCESNTAWVPSENKIEMKKEEVRKMFFDLKFSFCSIAESVCPLLTNHSWYKDWSNASSKQ